MSHSGTFSRQFHFKLWEFPADSLFDRGCDMKLKRLKSVRVKGRVLLPGFSLSNLTARWESEVQGQLYDSASTEREIEIHQWGSEQQIYE